MGALSAILFTGSALALNGVAGAEDIKPHKGHVHIEDHVHVDHGKDIKLKKVCAVAVRPHRYAGYDPAQVAFTITAEAKKPTGGSKAVPMTLGASSTEATTQVWKSLDPVIVHLDDVLNMAKAEGHYHVDKNGKVHDDRHFHVKVTVVDWMNRKWKRDIEVRGCDPTAVHNDPQTDPANDLPDEADTPDDNDATTTTTVDDSTDTVACLPPSQMFGSVVNSSVQAGAPVGIYYTGAVALDTNTVFMTVDGVDVDAVVFQNTNGVGIYYITPANFASGQHTATVSVRDLDDNCGEITFNFKSSQGSSNGT